jgi:pimeloyl-ACP methyl ester carboxylesterase
MSVIKHDGRPRSFHESGDRGMGCRLQEAEASRSKNMAKSLTRQTFGVPSQGVLEHIKPAGAAYSFEQQLGDLEAVVEGLGLEKIVPVAHDSSGMATLNYALTHPVGVDSVIMLNSAYSEDSTALWPEMITLFATRSMQALAIAIAQSPEQFGWLLKWQQKQFQDPLPEGQKPHFSRFIGPLISDNFIAQPGAGPAFVQLAAQLFDEHARNAKHLTALKTLDIPVKLIWDSTTPTSPWPWPSGARLSSKMRPSPSYRQAIGCKPMNPRKWPRRCCHEPPHSRQAHC